MSNLACNRASLFFRRRSVACSVSRNSVISSSKTQSCCSSRDALERRSNVLYTRCPLPRRSSMELMTSPGTSWYLTWRSNPYRKAVDMLGVGCGTKAIAHRRVTTLTPDSMQCWMRWRRAARRQLEGMRRHRQHGKRFVSASAVATMLPASQQCVRERPSVGRGERIKPRKGNRR